MDKIISNDDNALSNPVESQRNASFIWKLHKIWCHEIQLTIARLPPPSSSSSSFLVCNVITSMTWSLWSIMPCNASSKLTKLKMSKKQKQSKMWAFRMLYLPLNIRCAIKIITKAPLFHQKEVFHSFYVLRNSDISKTSRLIIIYSCFLFYPTQTCEIFILLQWNRNKQRPMTILNENCTKRTH